MEKRGRGRPRKIIAPVIKRIVIKKMFHCILCDGYFYKEHYEDAIIIEPPTNCIFCDSIKFEEVKEKA